MSFADSFRLPAMDARSLLDLADLSKEEQTLLKATYRTLALTLAAASAAVYLQLTSSSFLFHSMLPLLASFGLIAWLATTPPTPQNNTKREGILYGFGFVTGLQIGPLVSYMFYFQTTALLQALVGTVLIFASFSISAIYNKSRSYLYMGGFLMSALSVMFWMSLFNLFIRSDMLMNIQLYGGLLVMTGFVLFDTQLIILKARMGNKDHVASALSLFTDFISIFVRLMIILSRNQSNNSQNDRRRRR